MYISITQAGFEINLNLVVRSHPAQYLFVFLHVKKEHFKPGENAVFTRTYNCDIVTYYSC
jgi:hypothetical protein